MIDLKIFIFVFLWDDIYLTQALLASKEDIWVQAVYPLKAGRWCNMSLHLEKQLSEAPGIGMGSDSTPFYLCGFGQVTLLSV